MAKYITRTIKEFKADVSVYNEISEEMEVDSVLISSDKNVERQVKKIYKINNEPLILLKVIAVREYDMKYRMSEDDFIKYAELVENK